MEFETLWNKALDAGAAAAEATKPTPMVVFEANGLSDEPKPGGKSWYVPQGPCGFAWVTVRPGNSAFANWLKKQGYASKAYGGGVQYWVSQYGQSHELKSAFAYAASQVLTEAGVKASAGSRLD